MRYLTYLPAPVRHFLAVFIGSALVVVARAVVDASGVTGVNWTDTGNAAIAAGVAAGLATVGVFAVTPLTSSYGVDSRLSPPPADPGSDILEPNEVPLTGGAYNDLAAATDPANIVVPK